MTRGSGTRVWVWMGVLLLLVCVYTHGEDSGPGNSPSPFPDGEVPEEKREDGELMEGQCSADEGDDCSLCTWHTEWGVYSLGELSTRLFQAALQSPRGSTLQFYLCPSPPPSSSTSPSAVRLTCRNVPSPTCLNVPGVNPTITGKIPRVELLRQNVPGEGFRLIFEEGEICEVTKRPRVTVFSFPCSFTSVYKPQHLQPRKVHEGQNNDICRYHVEFPPSQFGCPIRTHGGGQREVEITAVTGCTDSDPPFATTDCHYAAPTRLSLHGLNLDLLCHEAPPPSPLAPQGPHETASRELDRTAINVGACTQNIKKHYRLRVGPYECRELKFVSEFTVECTLEGGTGSELGATIERIATDGRPSESSGDAVFVASLKGAVSFKEAIDFREKFSKFVELGVGGLKKEIEELYRRAFASRGTSPEVLEKLGISHVKGILLHGPPGSGKTLLARTIAQILGSKQVQLINGPEIISKYLGESEKNLRAHFKTAHEEWKQNGHLSNLYVIIIDEIDAICKPRGKSDQSAAGAAYDALVNQLLSLMDGLNEVHNTLVIGLTNRKELLDPALLRPGRFEVQIEVGLPDKEGRWEIFEIHTRSMRRSGMLSAHVDLWDLAANTTRFSGAEIAGVVRAAASYALDRFHSGQSDSPLVMSLDFQQATRDVSPAYTHSESHVLSNYLPLGYLPCGGAHGNVIDSTLDLIHTLRDSPLMRMQTLLLYGPRGSGKTTLAAQLAVLGKFAFTKILTASSLVGRPDIMKVDLLYQTFHDAFGSDLSIIVLDDLHRLVEYIKVGGQITVSHSLLHAVTTLLTTTPPAGARVLVVGTMIAENEEELGGASSLGLPDLFVRHDHVPLLDSQGALTFLTARNIHRSGGGQFSLPSNLAISIRQLLHAIECGCVQSNVRCSHGNRASPSHVKEDHLLDCIMAYVTRQGSTINGPGLYSG